MFIQPGLVVVGHPVSMRLNSFEAFLVLQLHRRCLDQTNPVREDRALEVVNDPHGLLLLLRREAFDLGLPGVDLLPRSPEHVGNAAALLLLLRQLLLLLLDPGHRLACLHLLLLLRGLPPLCHEYDDSQILGIRVSQQWFWSRAAHHVHVGLLPGPLLGDQLGVDHALHVEVGVGPPGPQVAVRLPQHPHALLIELRRYDGELAPRVREQLHPSSSYRHPHPSRCLGLLDSLPGHVLDIFDLTSLLDSWPHP